MAAERASVDVGQLEALYRLVGIIRQDGLRERGPYSVWFTPVGGQTNAPGMGAEICSYYYWLCSI